MEGFNWTHNDQVVTIFSAPNYCYRCLNKAAVIELSDNLVYKAITYNPAPFNDIPNVLRTVPDYFIGPSKGNSNGSNGASNYTN